MPLPDVGGYVLAGGKSSRMGRDKALLELAGKPLVLHAVTRLQRVCAEVHILSSRPELEVFAPLVRDLHEGCGPIGGLEAALEHSHYEWNLFVPVDVPFMPSALLEQWAQRVTGQTSLGARVSLFTIGGVPQPLCCLLHKDVWPFVRDAVAVGNCKVLPVLEHAARELAVQQSVTPESTFINTMWDEDADLPVSVSDSEGEGWRMLTNGQRTAIRLWFANLNTPEEFVEAERYAGALDT